MTKKATYVIVAVIMFMLYSYENILAGEIGPTLIEEIVGFILMLVGFFIGGKIVEKLLFRIENKWTWNDNPMQRIGIDAITIGVFSLFVSIAIIACTWLFFESFGIPESLDRRQQAAFNSVDNRAMDPMRRPPAHLPPPPKSGPAGVPHLREGRPERPPSPLGIKNANFLEAYKYRLDLLFGSVLLFLIVFLFEESALHVTRKEIKKFESMQLAQDQMLSKINALKGQINPHFMFNNLNTLSGLIHEDVDRADRFIQSLSKNLRYVLEQNKEVMVSLHDEVEFIKSYIHLQEERFGHKLKIEIDISESDLDYQLPALTLELLIENALKHNIVSTSNPLAIRIAVQDDFLVVENTYQPKLGEVISTGIGLQNLKEQLSLLGLEGASFGIMENKYIARVPMIRLPEIKTLK